MLQNDPDYNDKVLGCFMLGAPHILRISHNDRRVIIVATNGMRAEVPIPMFYKMSIEDLLAQVGVKADDTGKKRWD